MSGTSFIVRSATLSYKVSESADAKLTVLHSAEKEYQADGEERELPLPLFIHGVERLALLLITSFWLHISLVEEEEEEEEEEEDGHGNGRPCAAT